MGHYTIHVDGQRIGSILALECGRLAVCFNKRFKQYHDVDGTPEQVRWSLQRQCPHAKYEELPMPQLDAWLEDIDRKYAAMQEHRDIEGAMNI